jgi:hypothetical protein
LKQNGSHFLLWKYKLPCISLTSNKKYTMLCSFSTSIKKFVLVGAWCQVTSGHTGVNSGWM